MDLKCKKLNCKNNDRYSCMKEKICVSRSAECDSYEIIQELDDGQMQDASKDMFETAPDYHPYRHKKDVEIECGADCLFNQNTKCRANGISVCDLSKCALCTTFIKK